MLELGNGKELSVLIVSAFDPLEGEGNELIRYTYLAQAFVACGASVTYFSSSFEHFSKSQRKSPSSNLLYQVTLIPTPAYAKNVGWRRAWNHYVFGKKLIKYLNDTKSTFDVIVSAFPPISANARLSEWAQKRKIPFIVDIQDLWPEVFVTKLPAFPGESIFQGLFRKRKKMIDQALRVISVSQDYIDKLEIEQGKGVVFPLGANFPDIDFQPQKTAHIQLILIAGSDHLPFLPALIKQLENLPEAYKIAFIGRSQAFRHIQATDRISVYFEVNEHTKNDLLSTADIGLVLNDPALKSRMPNKVFSYLSYGLPIISNLKGGELENMLEEEKWGFTCEENLSDFSFFVEKLIGERLHENKQEIHHRAKMLFDKQAIYESYARYVVEAM